MGPIDEDCQANPYPAGWVDRLTEAVDKQPLPPSLSYFLAGALLVAGFIAVRAWQGG